MGHKHSERVNESRMSIDRSMSIIQRIIKSGDKKNRTIECTKEHTHLFHAFSLITV